MLHRQPQSKLPAARRFSHQSTHSPSLHLFLPGFTLTIHFPPPSQSRVLKPPIRDMLAFSQVQCFGRFILVSLLSFLASFGHTMASEQLVICTIVQKLKLANVLVEILLSELFEREFADSTQSYSLLVLLFLELGWRKTNQSLRCPRGQLRSRLQWLRRILLPVTIASLRCNMGIGWNNVVLEFVCVLWDFVGVIVVRGIVWEKRPGLGWDVVACVAAS